MSSSGCRPIRAAIASRRTCSSCRRDPAGPGDAEDAVALTSRALAGHRARPATGVVRATTARAGGRARDPGPLVADASLRSCPSGPGRRFRDRGGTSTRRPSRRSPARYFRPAAAPTRGAAGLSARLSDARRRYARSWYARSVIHTTSPRVPPAGCRPRREHRTRRAPSSLRPAHPVPRSFPATMLPVPGSRAASVRRSGRSHGGQRVVGVLLVSS